jgi:Tfp pilus assembly protein PilF
MKKANKIILGVGLLMVNFAIAQKDELKTLKKIYEKDVLSASDFTKYKETLVKLEPLVSTATEDDKVSYNYFKAITPIVELGSLGAAPTPMQIGKILNPETFTNIVTTMRTTLDYEKTTGKKVFTDDINEMIGEFKPIFKQMANVFFDGKKYKDASRVFYNTYQMDPKDGENLENAAISAMQAQDYVEAEKLYREIKTSGYNGSKVVLYATNKASGKEEIFENAKNREDMVRLGSHEKPRNEKIPSRKADFAKTLAALSFFNKNFEAAKTDFTEAIALNPDDQQLQMDQAKMYYELKDVAMYKTLIEAIVQKDPTNAQLHYNIGILSLEGEAALVDEINKNLKNKEKYKELSEKRKEIFRIALPSFEKAHQYAPDNVDFKNTLKSTYTELGMKEQAAKL